MHTITQMHAFEDAGCHRLVTMPRVAFGKGQDAKVGNGLTFDQTNTSQLRQRAQLFDTVVGEMIAAGKIDVSDTITLLDQLLDRGVREMYAMAHVDIVQISAQFCNGKYCSVGDFSAFGEDEISESWSGIDDHLDRIVSYVMACGQIQDPQTFEYHMSWEIEKGLVVEQMAVSDSQFAKLASSSDERRHRRIGDAFTLMQVNLQH